MTIATTEPLAPTRVVAGHLYELRIVDRATGQPCPWTLSRLAPWLGWRVVPLREAMLFHLDELDEAEEAVAAIAGGERRRYPRGLEMATVVHEYYE